MPRATQGVSRSFIVVGAVKMKGNTPNRSGTYNRADGFIAAEIMSTRGGCPECGVLVVYF